MAHQAVPQPAVMPTLMDVVWTPGGVSKPFRLGALALIGTLLLAVSAKIQVPLWPVPVTMQTFAVLVLGMAYGWRLAGATVLLYLAEGAIGLPVFAKGGGLAYFAGPTAGYLIGHLVAAMTVGWLAERGWDRAVLSTLGAMLIGNILIYACGIPWLASFLGDMQQAIATGLMPFLVGDAVKMLLAAAVLPYAWKLLDRS